MPDGTVLAYLYDGSFEGLLTCVFEAYSRRETPYCITMEENLQICFGQRAVHIDTDEYKAGRVERGIVKTIGSTAHRRIWTTFLSGDPNKATLLYRYICTGFSTGRRIYNDLAGSAVLPVNALHDHVCHEAHLLRGFARFSQLENGVYYGKIAPYNSVVPLLMPHFTDRFNTQPFLLHDTVHDLVGVYDLREWYLAETPQLELPELAPDEITYRRMWKHFYECLTIRERLNPKCRTGHMPKRFWSNLHEITFVETPATKRASFGAISPLR